MQVYAVHLLTMLDAVKQASDMGDRIKLAMVSGAAEPGELIPKLWPQWFAPTDSSQEVQGDDIPDDQIRWEVPSSEDEYEQLLREVMANRDGRLSSSEVGEWQ